MIQMFCAWVHSDGVFRIAVELCVTASLSTKLHRNTVMDENKKLCLNSGEIIDCLAGLMMEFAALQKSVQPGARTPHTNLSLRVLCKLYGAHEIV